jgi:hypothetical protein
LGYLISDMLEELTDVISYQVVAKVRGRLSVSKQAAQSNMYRESEGVGQEKEIRSS